MELEMLIIFIILAIIFVGLAVNKPLRQQLVLKFRGRTDELMNKDASTVEGAKDYYNNVIREKEEVYIKANNLYMEISGKLQSFEEDLYNKQKELFKINEDIKLCVDNGLDDDALRLAMKQETIKSQIEDLKEAIQELTKSKEQQKEYRELAEEEVQSIKTEKEKVVHELELNKQIIAIHQSMDQSNVSKESDRMLERVRNNARKTKELAKGSQIAYDSSLKAMDRKLEKSSRERSAMETVERLKKERGKL